MRYDFTKVQAAFAISGKTLEEVQALTGIHQTTISRAFRSGRAHQSTALALTKAFRISMKDIQVQPSRRKTA